MSIAFTMTALDLVTDAMHERRCLALARTPTAAEGEYGLKALNLMLKTLAADGVGSWAEAETTATITANVAEVVLSPRPADVIDASLVVSATNNRPLYRWTSEEYNSLPNVATSGEPTIFTLRETVSATYMRVWPVPTANRTIAYRYTRVLDDVVQDAALDAPQSWLESIKFMLAMKLTAFAQNNPDLPGLAIYHERKLYDAARPRSYNLAADCCD